jgi:flagellar hook assembly protein FlgD
MDKKSPVFFTPATTIPYTLSQRGHVKITIYNQVGIRIKTVIEKIQSAGRHEALWDGTDSRGCTVSNGIYVLRMTAGDVIQSKKIILMR